MMQAGIQIHTANPIDLFHCQCDPKAMANAIQMEDSWKSRLENEFQQRYMKELRGFLECERKAKKVVITKEGLTVKK